MLKVEDTNTGVTWIAFNGVELGLPEQLRATVPNLVTGRDYRFSVAAQSFNTIGAWSIPAVFYACTPPLVNAAPRRITSTIDSITIAWDNVGPDMDGGCSIFSYAIFVDDGLGGTFTEVNSSQDQLVRNKPGLQNLVITSPFTPGGGNEGRAYRIYVTAYNSDGSTES